MCIYKHKIRNFTKYASNLGFRHPFLCFGFDSNLSAKSSKKILIKCQNWRGKQRWVAYLNSCQSFHSTFQESRIWSKFDNNVNMLKSEWNMYKLQCDQKFFSKPTHRGLIFAQIARPTQTFGPFCEKNCLIFFILF